ncbi:MAG: hypothetical protein R3Y63_07715 [Eubacteriales bacterium]
MKGMDIYKSLGHISEEMVQEAEETTGKLSSHKWNWKYVSAMASSVALIFGLSLVFFQNGGSDGGVSPESSGAGGEISGSSESEGGIESSNTMAQVYTAEQLEKLTVQLTDIQKDGFRCIVTETSNEELFPIEAKLSVILEENTTIFTENGEEFVFNPDQSNIIEFGVEIGSVIEVDYLYYHEYQDTNGFYNRVIAETIKTPN